MIHLPWISCRIEITIKKAVKLSLTRSILAVNAWLKPNYACNLFELFPNGFETVFNRFPVANSNALPDWRRWQELFIQAFDRFRLARFYSKFLQLAVEWCIHAMDCSLNYSELLWTFESTKFTQPGLLMKALKATKSFANRWYCRPAQGQTRNRWETDSEPKTWMITKLKNLKIKIWMIIENLRISVKLFELNHQFHFVRH